MGFIQQQDKFDKIFQATQAEASEPLDENPPTIEDVLFLENTRNIHVKLLFPQEDIEDTSEIL